MFPDDQRPTFKESDKSSSGTPRSAPEDFATYRPVDGVRMQEKLDSLDVNQMLASHELKRLNGDMNAARAEIHSDRFQTIQILAFFVAFFTFVSVEFQLFANLKSFWHVIGLTFILAGVLLIFLVLFVRMTQPTHEGVPVVNRRKSNKFSPKMLIGISVTLITLGTVAGAIDGIIPLFASKSQEASFQDDRVSTCHKLMNELLAQAKEEDRQKIIENYNFLRCSNN